jgi:hypothetical protein
MHSLVKLATVYHVYNKNFLIKLCICPRRVEYIGVFKFIRIRYAYGKLFPKALPSLCQWLSEASLSALVTRESISERKPRVFWPTKEEGWVERIVRFSRWISCGVQAVGAFINV